MWKETALLRDEVHAMQPNKDSIWSFLEYCFLHLLPFLFFTPLHVQREPEKSEPNPFINGS